MSFQTKEITLCTPKRVILQDKNGPCPLVAVINTLILLDGVVIKQQSVTFEELVSELQSRTPTDLDEYKHCFLDGLDANPRFDGSFEGRTPDFFALFGLQLVHGWVIPESFPETTRQLSYDQLMDKVVSQACDTDVLMTQSFIDTHPSQLSPEGIKLLESTLEDGDVVVLFRNNHYSTLVKHNGLLLTLVTDQGFAAYNDIVWESLDGKFYQANFQQRQDCSHDEELARELQQQEDERGAGGSGPGAARYSAKQAPQIPSKSTTEQNKVSDTQDCSNSPRASQAPKKKQGKCTIA